MDATAEAADDTDSDQDDLDALRAAAMSLLSFSACRRVLRTALPLSPTAPALHPSTAHSVDSSSSSRGGEGRSGPHPCACACAAAAAPGSYCGGASELQQVEVVKAQQEELPQQAEQVQAQLPSTATVKVKEEAACTTTTLPHYDANPLGALTLVFQQQCMQQQQQRQQQQQQQQGPCMQRQQQCLLPQQQQEGRLHLQVHALQLPSAGLAAAQEEARQLAQLHCAVRAAYEHLDRASSAETAAATAFRQQQQRAAQAEGKAQECASLLSAELVKLQAQFGFVPPAGC